MDDCAVVELQFWREYPRRNILNGRSSGEMLTVDASRALSGWNPASDPEEGRVSSLGVFRGGRERCISGSTKSQNQPIIQTRESESLLGESYNRASDRNVPTRCSFDNGQLPQSPSQVPLFHRKYDERSPRGFDLPCPTSSAALPLEIVDAIL